MEYRESGKMRAAAYFAGFPVISYTILFNTPSDWDL